jgi:hypothetical protein
MPDYLSSLLQSHTDDKVASELSCLLILYILAQEYEINHYNDALRVCSAFLTSTPPHIKLARRLRKEISRHLKHKMLIRWLIGGTPLGKVMMGLFALLYFVIPISTSLNISESSTIFSIPIGRLAGPIALGILGSIFSILIRISEFSVMDFPDPKVPLLTGLLKPLVGGISALFIVLVLESKILPITVPEAGANYFYLAISFVAGFSERLVTVVITRAEGTVTPTQSKGSVDRRGERQPRRQR